MTNNKPTNERIVSLIFKAREWIGLTAQDYFDLAAALAELQEYRNAQQVVQGDGRDQFEEWFKFHHGDEHSIVTLHRANGGLNYRDPHVDLAWIAWKDSRAAMQSGAVKDGWVACSERMPEIYTWVHVYSPLAYIAEQILPDRLIEVGDPENGPFWDYHGREGVTHWQPLPAAPQQEAE